MHLPTLILVTRRKSWPTKEAIFIFVQTQDVFCTKTFQVVQRHACFMPINSFVFNDLRAEVCY